jgi:hypothetical protein
MDPELEITCTALVRNSFFKIETAFPTPFLRVKNHLAGLVSRQSLGLGHGEEEEEDGEVSETEAEDSDLVTDPDDEYIEVSQ